MFYIKIASAWIVYVCICKCFSSFLFLPGAVTLKLELVGWKGAQSLRAYVPKSERIHYLRLVGGDTSKYETNKFKARRENQQQDNNTASENNTPAAQKEGNGDQAKKEEKEEEEVKEKKEEEKK